MTSGFWNFIIELFKKWQEKTTPLPDPVLDPQPIPDPIPVEEKITIFDLDIIPDRMRATGFQGSDNALWYALAFVAAFGPGDMPDDGAGSLVELSKRSPEIETWLNGEVDKVIAKMKSNSKATATVIANDGRDRCGFRLGPPIMERLKEFGDRVQMGTIFPESEY